MYRKRFVSAVLAVALVIGCVPAVSLADKGGEPVYKVTFDEGSDKCTLVSNTKNGARADLLVDGKDGKAVRLDAEHEQYVQLADDITLGLDGDYTISVDVYPENEANFARVFDLGTDTTNFAYFTCMGGGVPKFRYKGDDLFSDGVFLKVNEWNNVTITREGGKARLFINGEIAATSRSFVQPLSALGKTDYNYLGKSHFPNDAYFTGMIDNFAIYDYALADEDIMTVNETAMKAKLVNVVFDENNRLISVTETDTVGELGASSGIKLKNDPPFDSGAALVKTYAYADGGEFKKVSEVRYGAPVNPLPEDTMETTIGVHDPSIFKDPKSGVYYVYSTGMIDIFKSEDLINWTKTTNTLPDLPQCVFDNYKHDDRSQYSNIWAPDMFYDESDTETPYHLTCSYSDEFGRNNSSIILFKASSPEGPWENGEIIFTSKSDDAELGKVNAIDSNICVDHETGQKYMVYGSFWQGIHIKELNEDGTVKDPNTVGTRIMSRKDGIGGPEGAYIVYNEGNGYYYLFTSFDSLSDTYNIRVARSKSITGPYVDQNGVNVDRFDAEDNTAVGYKLMGSWQFPNGNTYYGPGHCSVLIDNGKWYLVHHQRIVKGGYATLNVRQISFDENGWPIVTPERYNGEPSNDVGEVLGDWDIIYIGENTNAMLTSKRLTLNIDGTATLDGEEATWRAFNKINGGVRIKVFVNDETVFEAPMVYNCWDYDNARPTVQFTGTTQDGIEVWGKKAVNTVIYK